MKSFVIFLILIGFTTMIMPNVLASENLFSGTAIFERLPVTISPNTEAKFEIKFQYTEGAYSLSNVTAIVDITPQGAASFVHFNAEPFDVYQNSIARLPATISIDPDIEYEKIFLNISYIGTGINDVQFKSSWSDSLIFDIAPKDLTFTELPSSQDYEFERLTGVRCDGEVAICHGTFYNGTTIPVQCDYRHSCGVIPFDNDVFYQSPLKQFKSGIAPNDIICKDKFQLALNGNGHPVCIKGTSVEKLSLRNYISDLIIIGIPHALPVINNTEIESMVELFQNRYHTSQITYVGSKIVLNATNVWGETISLIIQPLDDVIDATLTCNHNDWRKQEIITENVLAHLQNKNCFAPALEETTHKNNAEPGPDYDSNKYNTVFDEGSPIQSKKTGETVLDADNCKRYAYWLTKYQKEKIDLYEDYPRYPPWGNEIFPLVDYCIKNGDLIKTIVNDKIQWSFSGNSEPEFKDEKITIIKISKGEIVSEKAIKFNGWTNQPNQEIVLTVTAPNGNVISTGKLSSMNNGTFVDAITTGGPLWEQQDGIYLVTVQQGNDPMNSAYFELELKDGNIITGK